MSFLDGNISAAWKELNGIYYFDKQKAEFYLATPLKNETFVETAASTYEFQSICLLDSD